MLVVLCLLASGQTMQVKEDVHRLQEKFKETYEGTQALKCLNDKPSCRERDRSCSHAGLQAHGDPWIAPNGRAHRLGQAGASHHSVCQCPPLFEGSSSGAWPST